MSSFAGVLWSIKLLPGPHFRKFQHSLSICITPEINEKKTMLRHIPGATKSESRGMAYIFFKSLKWFFYIAGVANHWVLTVRDKVVNWRSRSNPDHVPKKLGQEVPAAVSTWATCSRILAAAAYDRSRPISHLHVRMQVFQLPDRGSAPPLTSLPIHRLAVPCGFFKTRLNVLGKQDVLF